jgi:hypothetical protein
VTVRCRAQVQGPPGAHVREAEIRRVQIVEHRHEETRYLFTNQWQGRNITQAKPPSKCSPLRLLGVVPQKLAGEGKRHCFPKWSAPPLKCASDRTRQPLNVEAMGLGQSPDVEEVLHSAIRDSENHHRMEFLRDHRFRRVRPEHWSSQSQQHRKSEIRGGWVDEIAETNVDLHRHASAIQTCRHAHPNSFVFGILLDALSRDAS